jgi:hypothetical protein
MKAKLLGQGSQRRDFIRGHGGETVARPLEERAQQGERARRIGVLTCGVETDVADAHGHASYRG